MSFDEGLSSMILGNVEIIADIYKILKDAGLKATSREDVKASEENVNIVRAGIKDVNRFTAFCKDAIQDTPLAPSNRCRRSHRYSIKYDANDIIIVGGAALNIYDYMLRELKARRDIAALENYLKKKTSDIDVVWWPRAPTFKDKKGDPSKIKEIIVSSSEAIQTMVFAYKEELQKLFTENLDELQIKLKPYIGDTNLAINLKLEPFYSAGVWSIIVEFTVGDKVLKICDISIHDSGSSQLYDRNGEKVTDLRFMTSDPVYSNPRPGQPNSISYMNINGTDIAVPNVQSFVDQQMLAFNNLIMRGQAKAFINYKRVQFIKKILENIVLTNSNTQNKKELMEVFHTDNIRYPAMVINDIEEQEKVSISKLRDKILQLCRANTNDEFIKKLCERVSINEDAVQRDYLSRMLPEIERIKERLRQKSKNDKTTSLIRREYDDLFRGTDNLRVRLIQMKPLDVVEFSKGPDPLEPILSEEARINKVVQQLFANRQRAEDERRRAEEVRRAKAEEARRAEELEMARREQRRAEEQYRASMAARPPYQITHYPPDRAPQLPPGATWVPTPIIPLPHNRPPPPVYIDSNTGIHWYKHPVTGQVIVYDPVMRRWLPRDAPPVLMAYPSPPLPSGPPPRQYRGKGKGTRRNKRTTNATLKN